MFHNDSLWKEIFMKSMLTSDVQQSGKTLVTCSHPKEDHRANSRKKQKSKLQENQTKEI